MIQQSMRLKVLIMPLSLVIVVVLAIFFIKPSLTDMLSVKGQLAEKKSQLESLELQSQKLQKMKSEWEALSEEKTLVGTAIPDEKSAEAYVSEITSKASRSGILLTDITMDEQAGVTAAPGYTCSGNSANAASQSQMATTNSGGENLSGSAASLNSGCLESARISLKATGSWEQMLDFFKYLEDMNRITNIETLSLSSDTPSQDQQSSDLLTADISAEAFFKKQEQGGNAVLASALASQGKFNQNALEKLKEVIYAPYDAPIVSPGGERNIFK